MLWQEGWKTTLRGGVDRLKHMEQVVLKSQNLPVQLALLADNRPTQGNPSIPNHMAEVSVTDLLPGIISKPIWTNLGLNHVLGLPECEEFDAVLVVVNGLSKMWHYIPCHSTVDAWKLVESFLQEVVRIHGLLFTIVADHGPQFTSTIWGQICSHLDIDRRMVTAVHPQTDGLTERLNTSMKPYLCVYVSHQQDDWVKWLPLSEFGLNNGTSGSTKYTPFWVVLCIWPWLLFA